MSLIYINPYTFAADGIVTDGLVLHLDAGQSASYPGSGTTWTDLSPSGNNATLTNGPTYSSADGGSIVFDGSNDYAPIGQSGFPTGSSAGTLSTWVKSDVTSGFRFIVSYGSPNVNSARFLGMNGTTYLFGGYGNDITFSGLVSGVWFNMVGIYNGTNASMYINGTLVAGPTSKSWNTSANQTAQVGRQTNGNEYWDGNISQVTIYNRAITAAEVTQNFNALRGRYGL